MLVLLSGKPHTAELENAPVGAFDCIRADVRAMSKLPAIDRISVEKTDIGYRGVLFIRNQVFMWALNGSGFAMKEVDDGPSIAEYSVRLDDAEQEQTVAIEQRFSTDWQSNFNQTLATDLDPDPKTLTFTGPEGADPVERMPGSFLQLPIPRTAKTEAKCAGGVVVRDGKMLLVKPTNGFGSYDWTFPKGHSEGDERLEDTAVREVREETGWLATTERALGEFHHDDGGVCAYYVMKLSAEVPVSDFDTEETAAVRWASFEEALELLNDAVDVRIADAAMRNVPSIVMKSTTPAKRHEGVMVALCLPRPLARTIAVPGGEPAKDLHITLAYLGKALTSTQKRTVADVTRRLAGSVGKIAVTLTRPARFPATEHSDGKDVAYLAVESPDLLRVREMLVRNLERRGVEVKKNFKYTPHVTISYVAPSAPSPIKHFESVSLDFLEISAVFAGQRMDFPFSGLSKAERRVVKNPGSRGGKFWRDAKGNIRYGERPNLWVPPKPEEEIHSKANGMGVVFRTKESIYRVGTDHHRVFETLRTSRHKSAHSYLEKHHKPHWDTEGGERPYDKDAAHKWLASIIADMEADGVVEPGAVDRLKSTPAIAKKKPPKLVVKKPPKLVVKKPPKLVVATQATLFKQFNQAGKLLAGLENNALDQPFKSDAYQRTIRNGAKIRKLFGSALVTAGFTKAADVGTANFEVADTKTKDIDPSISAIRYWDGDIALSKSLADDLQKFFTDVGKRPLNHSALRGAHDVVHEMLHNLSDLTPDAYVGAGAFVEEVATEVAARRVTSTLFKKDARRDRSEYFVTSANGAYGEQIGKMIDHVATVMRNHRGAKGKAFLLAASKLEDACSTFKNRVHSQKATTAEQHVNNFVSAFDGVLSMKERHELRELINKEVNPTAALVGGH